MTMNGCGTIPAGSDIAVATPARMYDCYLGGTTHLPVDREAAGKALAAVARGRKLAWANRKFALHAARLMARRGIRQILDLGSGASLCPDIHDAVRVVNPDVTVLYADNDPGVCRNSPALAAGDGVGFLLADIRRPADLLARIEEYDIIDFSQPVGVLLVAVLHFLTWEDQPYRALQALTGRLVPGSYLALSHITSHGTSPDVKSAIEAAYAGTTTPATFRKRHEIGGFFQGLDLVKSGLVDVTEWRGNGQAVPSPPYTLKFLCGVARKNHL